MAKKETKKGPVVGADEAAKAAEAEKKETKPAKKKKEFPMVDNAKVLEILDENETAYHVRLDNGTTTWASKELFK